MSVSLSFLVMIALLLPSGVLEPMPSSEGFDDRPVVCFADSEEIDTPIEPEIEEPELFVAHGLLVEPSHQCNEHVSRLSRDHFADADLDSSGCRPPPIAS